MWKFYTYKKYKIVRRCNNENKINSISFDESFISAVVEYVNNFLLLLSFDRICTYIKNF